jgi:glycerol-3-phosphate dehydrogenase
MSDDNIKNAAVIGAGAMGNGIAQVLAMAGYKVTMVDVEQSFIIMCCLIMPRPFLRIIRRAG